MALFCTRRMTSFQSVRPAVHPARAQPMPMNSPRSRQTLFVIATRDIRKWIAAIATMSIFSSHHLVRKFSGLEPEGQPNIVSWCSPLFRVWSHGKMLILNWGIEGAACCGYLLNEDIVRKVSRQSSTECSFRALVYILIYFLSFILFSSLLCSVSINT